MGMRRETSYKLRPMALPVSRVSVYAEHMKDNLGVLAWTRPDFLCHMGNRRGMCVPLKKTFALLTERR